jgi:LacI family transcriptional regulator
MLDSPTSRSDGQGRRSTIKDVAAEAHVSISTVSLVMNDKGHVSPDTRERVLETARRLGYVPTQAARQLVARRTGNIGFVLREDHFTRSEPFYTRIFLGAEFEARHRNVYVLLASIPRDYVPGEHTPRFLRERNVDGLIVAGKVAPEFMAEVNAIHVPVVLVDYEHGKHPSVVIDNQQGARAAVEHLLARGHQRIAFVGADMSHPSLRARLDGYRLALGAAGLAFDESLVVTSEWDEPNRPTGSILAERMLRLTPRPTAVFCVNDALALGVLDRAAQQGLQVPGSLAVVGFDDVPGAVGASPPLTTVAVFKEQMGELALRYLGDLIDGLPIAPSHFGRGSHVIKVATELISRESA